MTDNQYFNPFTDRLSRDIRNDLSSALLQCLQDGSTESAETVAVRYLDQRLAEVYIRYIVERLDRYRKAVTAISGKVDDPFLRSFLLWDLGLFFEMHEVLEHDWYHAEGDTKLLMQALIRAAGYYIKRECNLIPQANKIASKALPVLDRQREFLARYFKPERLIEPLSCGNPVPPQLLSQ
jgi:uncharacterized protein